MNHLLTLYQSISRLPFGDHIFSKAVTLRTPYFYAIRPLVKELRSGYCLVEMRDHRRVRNKYGRISYGALCTLSDLTARLAIDGSIANGLRWITRKMSIDYVKKPMGTVSAEARLDYHLIGRDKESKVSVNIFDRNGIAVAEVTVSFYICSAEDYELLYV